MAVKLGPKAPPSTSKTSPSKVGGLAGGVAGAVWGTKALEEAGRMGWGKMLVRAVAPEAAFQAGAVGFLLGTAVTAAVSTYKNVEGYRHGKESGWTAAKNVGKDTAKGALEGAAIAAGEVALAAALGPITAGILAFGGVALAAEYFAKHPSPEAAAR